MSCLEYLGYSVGVVVVAVALLALVAYRAAEWLVPSSAVGVVINVLLGWFALTIAFALPAFVVMRFDATGAGACGTPLDGVVLLVMYLLFPIYLGFLLWAYRNRKVRSVK